MANLNRVAAVTFDFFNTLVFHRDGRGRGKVVMEYLHAHGLEPMPWEHQVLYDIFAAHEADAEAKHEQYGLLARRLFRRLGVAASDDDVARHALPLWQILGPSAFGVFADVPATLRVLKAAGYPLAVVSNWPCGLRHFCAELRLSDYFDHVLASGEVGVAKPDTGLFSEACARLGVRPERVLHIGDSLIDDYSGGEAAGFSVLLLDRELDAEPRAARVIHSLEELPGLLDGAGESPR